jgi:hypothetical protein
MLMSFDDRMETGGGVVDDPAKQRPAGATGR